MTDFAMISLLSDGELDAVTGGTLLVRAARSSITTTVSQQAQGGFVGDFTVSNTYRTSLNSIGNTSNSSSVNVTSVTVA